MTPKMLVFSVGFLRSKPWRLILDSRVVMGQFWRNRLFFQAFHGIRDRGGIFGTRLLISCAEVLYRVCKTPESNKSPVCYRGDPRPPPAPASGGGHAAGYQRQKDSAHAGRLYG